MPRAKPIVVLSSAIGNTARHDLIVVRRRTRLPHTPTRAPAANPLIFTGFAAGARISEALAQAERTGMNAGLPSCWAPNTCRRYAAPPPLQMIDRKAIRWAAKRFSLFNAHILLFNALPPFRFLAKNALSRSLLLRSQGCLSPTALIKGLEANRLPGR